LLVFLGRAFFHAMEDVILQDLLIFVKDVFLLDIGNDQLVGQLADKLFSFHQPPFHLQTHCFLL
jgi:hypothetical protein